MPQRSQPKPSVAPPPHTRRYATSATRRTPCCSFFTFRQSQPSTSTSARNCIQHPTRHTTPGERETGGEISIRPHRPARTMNSSLSPVRALPSRTAAPARRPSQRRCCPPRHRGQSCAPRRSRRVGRACLARGAPAPPCATRGRSCATARPGHLDNVGLSPARTRALTGAGALGQGRGHGIARTAGAAAMGSMVLPPQPPPSTPLTTQWP